MMFSRSFGQAVVYDTIQYAKEYHQKRLDVFKNQPIAKHQIVLLGNSITEFGDWQKLLKNNNIINQGIAGDNTFGVLARLENIIKLEPKKLFLEIGINDVSQNIPSQIIIKNITTIAQQIKAKSPKTKVYVYSILPTNDNVKNNYPEAFNKNETIKSINQNLRQKAKSNKFTYIDLNKILSDNQGKLNTKYADPDGLHLNSLGYQTCIKLLKSKQYL